MKDIRHLIDLEAAGLIQGPTGLGLSKTHTFDSDGNSFLIEGNIVLHLSSIPGEKIAYGVMALTPLGQELLGLLPNRDVRQCARDYANAIKTPQIKAVFLGFAADNGQFIPTEVVWQDSAEIINQTDITPPSPPIPAPPP